MPVGPGNGGPAGDVKIGDGRRTDGTEVVGVNETAIEIQQADTGRFREPHDHVVPCVERQVGHADDVRRAAMAPPGDQVRPTPDPIPAVNVAPQMRAEVVAVSGAGQAPLHQGALDVVRGRFVPDAAGELRADIERRVSQPPDVVVRAVE